MFVTVLAATGGRDIQGPCRAQHLLWLFLRSQNWQLVLDDQIASRCWNELDVSLCLGRGSLQCGLGSSSPASFFLARAGQDKEGRSEVYMKASVERTLVCENPQTSYATINECQPKCVCICKHTQIFPTVSSSSPLTYPETPMQFLFGRPFRNVGYAPTSTLKHQAELIFGLIWLLRKP